MTFYLIFNDRGKFMGYTEKKKYALELIEQRKKFQTLYIEKFTDKMLGEEATRDIINQDGDIFNYYGIYLFEHEEDLVHTTCFESYMTIVNSVEGYLQSLDFIKFDDEEKMILEKYSAMMLEVGDNMMNEYYLDENPHAKMLKIKKLVLKILKDKYKGDKRKK